MTIYECKLCSYVTSIKCQFTRHTNTKKHTTIIQHIETLNTPIKEKKEFACKYCEREFKYSQSMYRHIKYTCTKNKDEDLQELVRLMNLQLQQKDKQIDVQSKQIEKLVCKLEINGSFNTTINNIQLLAYNDSDISHLTEKDYSNCIKQVNFCVKKLIEKIHFNPLKPENMNIYISNLKDKYLMLYENGNWTIKNKNVLERVYEDKEMMLEDWLDEEQHKYPELKEKFLRYINNKEHDDTLNMIKEEIKLMIYNKTKIREIKIIEG